VSREVETTPTDSRRSPERARPEPRELVAAAPYGPGPGESPGDAASIRGRRRRYGIIGIATLAIAFLWAVFFLLPSLVPAPVPSPAEETVPSAGAEPRERPEANPGAPEGAAKEASQQIEALRTDLIGRIRRVEGLGASHWANTDLARLRLQLEAADELRDERPEVALAAFVEARSRLEGLEDRAVSVLRESLGDGNRALERGDRARAEEKLALALMIDPANEEAKKALARAKSIQTVFELLSRGREQEDAGQLSKARDLYEQAREVDPEAGAVDDALRRIDTKIQEARFREAMSAGIEALSAGRVSAARDRFRRALEAKPGSPAALEGLAQVADAQVLAGIRSAKRDAEKAVDQEAWSDALASYERALKLDPTLSFAQQGKARATLRAQLDERLERFRSQPKRLETEAVRQEAVELLRAAAALPSPGPRLQEQLETVASAVEAASSEIPVTFVSDGVTEVSVYRVGQLGRFARHTVDLHPGSYTAVGQRDGFRDVLQRFTITAGEAPPRVEIRCQERL